MTPSPIDRPLSRRALLRGATVVGTGALAAYAVGCGDGDGGASPTATAPAASPTSAPAGTATPYLPTSASWRRIEPEGVVPSPRRDHSLTTDGDLLTVYGGRNGTTTLGDAWYLNLEDNTGHPISSDGAPTARFGHAAVTQERSVLIFGGQDGADFFNDLPLLTPRLNNWFYIPVDGLTPTPRYGAAAALDNLQGLLITHGFTTDGRFDDTWLHRSNAWNNVSPEGPRPIQRCLTRAV